MSFILSWSWALLGFLVFTILVHAVFMPVFAEQFTDNMTAVKPLFWGSCICYFIVGWFMISERRLPYANNFEVLASTAFVLTCLLLLFLAAAREFYSGTYLAIFLGFQWLWFGLEVYFRNHFISYRFLAFPTAFTLTAEDFPEHDVSFAADPEAFTLDGFDAVIVDFNSELNTAWMASLAQCQNAGIPIIPLNAFLENAWGRIPLETSNFAVLAFSASFRPYLVIKPMMERLAAGIALILAAPVLFAAALMVKCTSRGPALFRQSRVGLDNKPFTIYKLRTMRDGSEQLGAYATTENDERLTRIGSFLRKYHIDELPQLLNVVKGDMAIVGPRPETTELTELYAKHIKGYRLRNAMRPGVTSWALIHQGNVSGIEATKIKLSYDLYYLKHVSSFLDFYIILKTLWVMLIGIETLKSPTSLKIFTKDTQ